MFTKLKRAHSGPLLDRLFRHAEGYVWPILFPEPAQAKKGLRKDKEKETDRRKGGKKNINEWTVMDFASSTQAKLERDCCELTCGAPKTFQGYGIE